MSCCSLGDIYFKEEKGWECLLWKCRNCGWQFKAKRTINDIEILEGEYIPLHIGMWKYLLYRIGWLPEVWVHTAFSTNAKAAMAITNVLKV